MKRSVGQIWKERIGPVGRRPRVAVVVLLVAVCTAGAGISSAQGQEARRATSKTAAATTKTSADVAALKDSFWRDRYNAAEALGKIGGARAIAPLVAVLRDNNLHVRAAAAEALKQLNYHPPTPTARVWLLVAAQKWARAAKLGAPAVQPLIAVLNTDYDDAHALSAAAGALVKIGAPAVKPLVAVLKGSDSWVLARSTAAKALGGIGRARAVPPLVAALKDSDDGVRQRAAEALGEIGDARAVEPLVVALKDSDYRVCSAAARALVKIGPPSVKALIAVLKYNDSYVRQQTVEALGEIGDARAVPPLLAALKDSDGGVRWVVAEALGKIGDARAVEPLVSALKDSDHEVRWAAASALKKFNYHPATPDAQAWLFVGASEFGKAAKLGAPAVEPLITVLNEGASEDNAGAAAELLGEIGGARAVKPLIAALRNSDSGVRKQAAEALGEIKDDRAVQPLVSALKDSDNEVREAAAESLITFNYHPATPEAQARLLVTAGEYDQAVKLGTPAVAPLVAALKKALNDNNIWTLAEAEATTITTAAALGKIGDARAVAPLVTALNNNDADARQAAARALGEIGGARAVKSLIAALEDWDSGKSAADALDKLGWKPATNPERVHLWVARRDLKELSANWPITKNVLLGDVRPGHPGAVRNALLTLIGIGKSEIVPELVAKLNEAGDATMAEEYLNCGEERLKEAGAQWAKNHGYEITPSTSYHYVGWGSMGN